MLMILQKFGQCPLVFTLFGKRSDYELLDVSLKSWKKKTTFCVISAWRRTKMHVLGLYGFVFWIDWPKVKDSWRKHFDACKSLATFIKCYVDRTTLSCPQIYIYISLVAMRSFMKKKLILRLWKSLRQCDVTVVFLCCLVSPQGGKTFNTWPQILYKHTGFTRRSWIQATVLWM